MRRYKRQDAVKINSGKPSEVHAVLLCVVTISTATISNLDSLRTCVTMPTCILHQFRPSPPSANPNLNTAQHFETLSPQLMPLPASLSLETLPGKLHSGNPQYQSSLGEERTESRPLRKACGHWRLRTGHEPAMCV